MKTTLLPVVTELLIQFPQILPSTKNVIREGSTQTLFQTHVAQIVRIQSVEMVFQILVKDVMMETRMITIRVLIPVCHPPVVMVFLKGQKTVTMETLSMTTPVRMPVQIQPVVMASSRQESSVTTIIR